MRSIIYLFTCISIMIVTRWYFHSRSSGQQLYHLFSSYHWIENALSPSVTRRWYTLRQPGVQSDDHFDIVDRRLQDIPPSADYVEVTFVLPYNHVRRIRYWRQTSRMTPNPSGADSSSFAKYIEVYIKWFLSPTFLFYVLNGTLLFLFFFLCM